MVFDPVSQQLKCPYCGALRPFQITRETPNEYDIRFAPPSEDAAWGDETRTVRCGKCAAELVLTGEISLEKLVWLMTTAPRKRFGISFE